MKERRAVSLEDTWDLTILYKTSKDWEKAVEQLQKTLLPSWKKLSENTTLQDPIQLKKILDSFFAISRELSKIYAYAHHNFDTELTNDLFKSHMQQAAITCQSFEKESAWLEPCIGQLSESIFTELLNHPELSSYHFFLEKLYRNKKHLLSESEEKLLAMASLALETPHKAFSALNDADMDFGSVSDGSGKTLPLSHGTYSAYLRSPDRVLRKNAFSALHAPFLKHENTLCELLSGHVHLHNFSATARGFSSSLEAALKPKNIATQVYHNLIQTVESFLPELHRYMRLRKDILQLDELHLYDVYVPLFTTPMDSIPYDTAVSWVIDSTSILGDTYQKTLHQGLTQNRWVDKFENKSKRSGAYSGGCYDSYPYILLNYNDTLNSVFTLAHEAGHSMHSYYSKQAQPYHLSHYSIFIAEVASTFNEDLLLYYLLDKTKSKQERLYLVNQKLEDIRATLFRQTMFAEFELYIHNCIEKHKPVTPNSLKDYYIDLNKKYFGTDIIIDNEIAIEWARIPHFYSNFYVYQYATGIAAALSLSEQLRQGSTNAREAYLQFLSLGGSVYPLDALKVAGVDMTTPEPIVRSLKQFSVLIDQLQTAL